MNGLVQDLRYAFRQLRKSPGFACTAVLILALGIGASVAIFGFVDAALIKPLPYANPNRLVDVTESAAMIPHANLSYPDYLDWKKLNHVFSSLEVYTGGGYLLRTPAGTEPVPGVRVSDGFFHTLGIAPVLGRDFFAGEDLPSAPRTVILSYATWQKRFGGRKDVTGETVALSGIPYAIVGVLPQDFQFALRGNVEFWTTLHASDQCALRRSCHNLNGIGRLQDGVSVEMARAEMKTIARQLELQYPNDNRDQSASVLPLAEVIVADIRPILLVLLGGAGLLLVIACVNVSSLLLVRSASRKRDCSAGRVGCVARTPGSPVHYRRTGVDGGGQRAWLGSGRRGHADPHAPHLERHDGGNAVPGGTWPELSCVAFCRSGLRVRGGVVFFCTRCAPAADQAAGWLERRRPRLRRNPMAPFCRQPGGRRVGDCGCAAGRRRIAGQEFLSLAPCRRWVSARSSGHAGSCVVRRHLSARRAGRCGRAADPKPRRQPAGCGIHRHLERVAREL